jgi:hypothetical protein
MGLFFNISPQIHHRFYSTLVRPQPGDESDLLWGYEVIIMAFTKKCCRLLFSLLGEAKDSQPILHSRKFRRSFQLQGTAKQNWSSTASGCPWRRVTS